MGLTNLAGKISEIANYCIKYTAVLTTTNSFEEFESVIDNEVKSWGLERWTFALLDIPDRQTALKIIGKPNQQLIDKYLSKSFHNHDLALQHVKASNHQIFKSDIELGIASAPQISRANQRYLELQEISRSYDNYDSFLLPVRSSVDGSRFMFSLVASEKIKNQFKVGVCGIQSQILGLASAICAVGAKRYEDKFVSPKREFEKIKRSKPLYILYMMAENDLTISQTAEQLGISASTVGTHLVEARRLLGASTNHGAYITAKNSGYFDNIAP